jgi:dihydropteroate synthase
MKGKLPEHVRIVGLVPQFEKGDLQHAWLILRLQLLLAEDYRFFLSRATEGEGWQAWKNGEAVLVALDLRNASSIPAELEGISASLQSEIKGVLSCFCESGQWQWKFQDRLLSLGQRTHIMGVINVTPDSFSDGGLFFDADRAVAHGLELVRQGADILDIGGESTRPGAEPVPEKEELRRVIPVIEGIRAHSDVPISIDTYKSRVAEEALKRGANIINDISGLRFDARMVDVARAYDAGLVVMHIQGTPRDMQKHPTYTDVVEDILRELDASVGRALDAGISPERIVVDPGIGFGKRWFDNYDLIHRLREFYVLGLPVLIGASRKSFLGKILNVAPQERLEGTIAAHTLAIWFGAHIIRVHDVEEARRAARITDVFVRRAWGVSPEMLEEFHG